MDIDYRFFSTIRQYYNGELQFGLGAVVRMLGLSLIIIGLLLLDIALNLSAYLMIDDIVFIFLEPIAIMITCIGIIITIIGYYYKEDPLTEKRLLEILRDPEFNTTEILHRITVDNE